MFLSRKYKDVYFVERNIHGAWVVYGTIGIRQYYYYTKGEAISSQRRGKEVRL